MFTPPPPGSKIRIETERGHSKIIAPHGSGSWIRYIAGAFLIAWLAAWAVGWVVAAGILILGSTGNFPAGDAATNGNISNGEPGAPPPPPSEIEDPAAENLAKGIAIPFLCVWLTMWTIGGGMAGWFAYRIFRPSVPETLLLSLPTLVHDPGIPPVRFSVDYRSQMQMWKQLLKRRQTREFDEQEIRTLRLRETDRDNRVTIDQGKERIDLGTSLTEVEREWLFANVANLYKVEKIGRIHPAVDD